MRRTFQGFLWGPHATNLGYSFQHSLPGTLGTQGEEHSGIDEPQQHCRGLPGASRRIVAVMT